MMLYLDKAVVTRTMTMLEKKGLVYREQDARDKRAKHVYLTEYGKEQHAYLRNVIQRWVDYLVADMAPADVETIVKGFDHLVDRACRAAIRQRSVAAISRKISRWTGQRGMPWQNNRKGLALIMALVMAARGGWLRPEGCDRREGAARQDTAGRQRHGSGYGHVCRHRARPPT